MVPSPNSVALPLQSVSGARAWKRSDRMGVGEASACSRPPAPVLEASIPSFMFKAPSLSRMRFVAWKLYPTSCCGGDSVGVSLSLALGAAESPCRVRPFCDFAACGDRKRVLNFSSARVFELFREWRGDRSSLLDILDRVCVGKDSERWNGDHFTTSPSSDAADGHRRLTGNAPKSTIRTHPAHSA